MSVTLTPNYIVGEAIAVSLGGNLLAIKSGKVDRKAAVIKVTNATSGGHQQVKAGTKMADFSGELAYNGDSPPTIVEGTELTFIFDAVGYEVSEGLANASTMPTGRLITGQFLVSGVSDTWQCESDYSVSLTATSTGAYTVVDTATGATPIT